MSLQAVRRPISDLPILAKISVRGHPDWVAIGENAVWLSAPDTDDEGKDSQIVRIDPVTNKVVAKIPVGSSPCSGLGLGFGSVWVPCCGDGQVDRIDILANKVIASIPTTVGDSEGGIAVDPSGVWLAADSQGTIVHIDPTNNSIVGSVKTVPGSFVVAAGEGAIWVTSTAANLLSRIDPHTHKVTAQREVRPGPHFLAVGEGAVWVLNQGDGSVARVDPATNKVISTIQADVPGIGGDIAVGEGFVWVTAKARDPSGKPLTKIDPATNKVVVQFVGIGGDALRVGHGAIWMCSFFLQEAWHVGLNF
jgi:virginiamycin B lyase